MKNNKTMKVVTDESTITPVVKNLDSEIRHLIRYDKNLLDKINADILVVREYGLAVDNALAGTNELEFAQRLKHFKLALKSHLRKVGVKLYVYLRHELQDDPRASSFSTFEKVITQELLKVANYLTRAKNADWSEREALRVELLSVLNLILKIDEQEKEFLHPVYLECANKQPDFTQTLNEAASV